MIQKLTNLILLLDMVLQLVQLDYSTIRLWYNQERQCSRTHQLGFYQSCQLECTNRWIALVARAYHS